MRICQFFGTVYEYFLFKLSLKKNDIRLYGEKKTIAHLYSKHLEVTFLPETENVLLTYDIFPIKCR